MNWSRLHPRTEYYKQCGHGWNLEMIHRGQHVPDWHRNFVAGNLKVDSLGRLWRRRSPPSVGSQLVVPVQKRHDFIKQFHDSLFAGHLGITRTVFRLLDRVYWPGLRRDVQTYIKSCTICIARKSPCPRKVPMGHVEVGHRWERVATVQITFIFIGQTHLVFGKCVCTCVMKHSNAFQTFLNWLKNSKRVWHERKLHIMRVPLFANFDR